MEWRNLGCFTVALLYHCRTRIVSMWLFAHDAQGALQPNSTENRLERSMCMSQRTYGRWPHPHLCRKCIAIESSAWQTIQTIIIIIIIEIASAAYKSCSRAHSAAHRFAILRASSMKSQKRIHGVLFNFFFCFTCGDDENRNWAYTAYWSPLHYAVLIFAFCSSAICTWNDSEFVE